MNVFNSCVHKIKALRISINVRIHLVYSSNIKTDVFLKFFR